FVEGELQGDRTSKGMAHNMSGVPAFGVHQYADVLRHLLDGDLRSHRLTVSHSPVIEGQTAITVLQPFDLRGPAVPMNSHSLDQNDGRPFTFNVVRQSTISVLQRLLFGHDLDS